MAILLTHSQASCEKSELLADVLGALADEMIEDYDKSVALLSMEGLNTVFTDKIQSLMKHADKTKVFTSSQYDASQMASVLRSPKIPATSRYYAGVLSLANQVPQTAIGHNLRIKDIHTDLGIDRFFVDHDPNRYELLGDNVARLFSNLESFREKLRQANEQYTEREERNHQLLKTFLETHYLEWLP